MSPIVKSANKIKFCSLTYLDFIVSSSQAVVCCVDETTGGLEVTHQLVLSSKDYPGCPGKVRCIRWTPDGRCVALAWANGGLSLWSTFGALLLCSLGWDYGLHSEAASASLLNILSMVCIACFSLCLHERNIVFLTVLV